MLPRFLCGATLALSFCACALADDFTTVALSGDPGPFGQPYTTDLQSLTLGEAGTSIYFAPDVFSGVDDLFRRPFGLPAGGVGPATPAPGGGTLTHYDSVDANPAGDLAFAAETKAGPTNLYALIGKKLRPVALVGGTAPSGGKFSADSFITTPALGARGQVAFHGLTTDSGRGIYLATPTATAFTLVRIAAVGDDSLDGGKFTDLDYHVEVASPATGLATVAFYGVTSGSAGRGLYLGTPGALRLAAPGAPQIFRMNNAGALVYVKGDLFLAAPTGTGGPSAVVHVGDPAPGGGTFATLSDPAINDAGDIVFTASLQPGNAKPQGVFLRTAAGALKAVARSAAPGGATFQSFDPPQINNAGLAMFNASTSLNNQLAYGLFLGDGTDLRKVIQTGDALLDSTVDAEGFSAGTSPSPGVVPDLPGHGSFNVHGQVAFRAKLHNGKSGIFASRPLAQWRAVGTGLWDTAANWFFTITPAPALDVVIDPAADVVVTGPAAAATVHSLQIGGGVVHAMLLLQPGGPLTATTGTTVATGSTLGGAGTLGGPVTLSAGAEVALQLRGRVRGSGYDFLHFLSPVALAGTLRVTTAGGFTPAPGDSFDLLDFQKTTGGFTTVLLPALTSAALQWDQSQLATAGQVSVLLAAPLQGAYAGRIVAEAAASSGSLSVTVKSGGSFRAIGTIGGKPFTFSGQLDATGAATSAALDAAGHRVRLQLDFAHPDAGALSGALLDSTAATVASITAQQTPLFTKAAPSPYAGAYTLALPADPAHTEATYPQGTGYATVTVSTTGRARLAGALGDGTKLSAGGAISAQGGLSIFLPLYAKKGFLSGQLTLTGPAATQALTGALHWSKPATATPAWFPAAFAGDIAAMGSGFQLNAAHPALLNFPNGGTFSVTGGNIPAPAAESVTIDSAHQNAVAFTPPGPKLKFTGATFAGTFPGATKAVAFSGVVLQKQNLGVGYLKGAGQTGTVELDAK